MSLRLAIKRSLEESTASGAQEDVMADTEEEKQPVRKEKQLRRQPLIAQHTRISVCWDDGHWY